MISTNLKDAVELAIRDFNAWAIKADDWIKRDLNDIKGVFTEMMYRRLKILYDINLDSSQLHNFCKPSIVKVINVVKPGFIKELTLFNKEGSSDNKEKLTHRINLILRNIDYTSLIPVGVTLDIITTLDNCINSINNFKIN